MIIFFNELIDKPTIILLIISLNFSIIKLNKITYRNNQHNPFCFKFSITYKSTILELVTLKQQT